MVRSWCEVVAPSAFSVPPPVPSLSLAAAFLLMFFLAMLSLDALPSARNSS